MRHALKKCLPTSIGFAATLPTKSLGAWINLNEVAICVCGGTTHNLTLGYEVIDEPQMATAKGLYLVAKKRFAV